MAFAGNAFANVVVTKIDYNGWRDSYMMRNESTTLIYSPQVGRIMYYGFTDGENILWENPDVAGKTYEGTNLGKDWVNFGGDKLWPAPQSRWNWPPSPILDRGGSTVEVLPNRHLLITGMVDPALGIGFVREIALDAKSSKVTLRNTLVNRGKVPVEWSVWEIVQVNDPDEVILPRGENPKFANGYLTLGDTPLPAGMATPESREIIFKRSPVSSGKIGSDSPLGLIRGVFKSRRQPTFFTLSAKRESGKPYPDGDCSLQIYGNADPAKYVEMEILSPIVKIEAGKSYSFATHWELKLIQTKPVKEKRR